MSTPAVTAPSSHEAGSTPPGGPTEPLVSVVVPTHNRASLLARALRSALAQTYRHIEVLVMDDASSDDTEAIVREIHDPRLHYVRHPRRVGIQGNYASGLHRAAGDYVAFLSDDDWWHADFVSHRVALLAAHPGHVVAFSGYERCNEQFEVTGRFTPPLQENVTLDRDTLLDATIRRDFTIASSLYDRRAVLEIWPELAGCGGAFDTALQLQIAIRHPAGAVYGGWCDILYTVHPGQVSTSPRHFDEGALMYESMLRTTRSVPWAAGKIRRDYSAWQVTRARDLAVRGELRRARRFFLQAIRIDPSNLAAWSQLAVSLALPRRLRAP